MSEYVRITDRKIELTDEGVDALMADYTPTTEEVRDRYASQTDAYPEFDRWLAEHDKKVIAKAFHEWADFQIDSLRVAPTTDEDYEEAKRYADAAKYWADNIILKGETE